MKTTRINGQKFARIEYAYGVTTWYPIVNLRWLSKRCAFTFAK